MQVLPMSQSYSCIPTHWTISPSFAASTVDNKKQEDVKMAEMKIIRKFMIEYELFKWRFDERLMTFPSNFLYQLERCKNNVAIFECRSSDLFTWWNLLLLLHGKELNQREVDKHFLRKSYQMLCYPWISVSTTRRDKILTRLSQNNIRKVSSVFTIFTKKSSHIIYFSFYFLLDFFFCSARKITSFLLLF